MILVTELNKNDISTIQPPKKNENSSPQKTKGL